MRGVFTWKPPEEYTLESTLLHKARIYFWGQLHTTGVIRFEYVVLALSFHEFMGA